MQSGLWSKWYYELNVPKKRDVDYKCIFLLNYNYFLQQIKISCLIFETRRQGTLFISFYFIFICKVFEKHEKFLIKLRLSRVQLWIRLKILPSN